MNFDKGGKMKSDGFSASTRSSCETTRELQPRDVSGVIPFAFNRPVVHGGGAGHDATSLQRDLPYFFCISRAETGAARRCDERALATPGQGNQVWACVSCRTQ